MSTEQKPPVPTKMPPPTFSIDEDGSVHVNVDAEGILRNLFNVETEAAASGLMRGLINALGRSGENYRDMAAAMLVEVQPRDAIEAMLISQMTATQLL